MRHQSKLLRLSAARFNERDKMTNSELFDANRVSVWGTDGTGYNLAGNQPIDCMTRETFIRLMDAKDAETTRLNAELKAIYHERDKYAVHNNSIAERLLNSEAEFNHLDRLHKDMMNENLRLNARCDALENRLLQVGWCNSGAYCPHMNIGIIVPQPTQENK